MAMSKELQTALAFLDSFKTLDYERNVSLRTPDCIHTFGPTSLKITEKTNEQFAAHLKSLQPKIVGIPVTPKQIFEAKGQVVIWATGEGKFRDEVKALDPTADWTYYGEYMFVFTFNEEGDKIKHVLEFLDSKKVEGMRELVKMTIK